MRAVFIYAQKKRKRLFDEQRIDASVVSTINKNIASNDEFSTTPATAAKTSTMTFNTTATVHGQSSKILLSAFYFVLAVICGWALKHHNGGHYSLAAFALLFVHSVLSVLRYTHPNAGHVQRAIGDQCTVYVPLLFVALIVTQLLLILDDISDLVVRIWLAGSTLIYTLKLLATICCRSRLPWQQQCTNICVLWHIAFLARIAYTYSGCYWTAGLACLVLLNHFVLWRLRLHFSISHLEVSTVGLCFTVLFAMNAVEEITETFQFPYKHER